ncbi:MAG: tetratricopeptide (TPR) repeat protein [Myxococcota bacterium]
MVGTWLVLVMMATTSVAVAQTGETDDDRARELFDNGAVLFEEGRYDAAIEAWESGFSLSPRPLFLYNLAGAYERLGNLDQTVATLDAYRAVAPEAERATLSSRISALERRIREGHNDNRSPLPTVPVALASVSAASLAVGIGFGASSLSSGETAKDLCVSGLCDGAAQPAVLRNRRHALVADTAFAIAIATAGVGVAVWASQGKQISVAVGARSVALQGRF